jgi:hypothetical protein
MIFSDQYPMPSSLKAPVPSRGVTEMITVKVELDLVHLTGLLIALQAFFG